VSYDITPPPEGADPEKWAVHERGACGGYYKCAFCAEIIGRAKLLEEQTRLPTQTGEDAARARAARRVKAKAARRARKAQRRASR
jgi:hypothetical protein